MGEYVAVNECGVDMLYMHEKGEFTLVEKRFLAPKVEKNDLITIELLKKFGADVIEHYSTYSIYSSRFCKFTEVIELSRYLKLFEKYIFLNDEKYITAILSPAAFLASYTIFRNISLFVASQDEIKDIMNRLEYSNNIICVHKSFCKVFKEICEYIGVKLLWKGYDFFIFRIPYETRKESLKLAVPKELLAAIIGEKAQNIIRIANDMNVSNINLI